jgi:hypothetical protein
MADPKELLLQNLIQDVKTQMTPDRVSANHELTEDLMNAFATGGAIDDKQYVVSYSRCRSISRRLNKANQS